MACCFSGALGSRLSGESWLLSGPLRTRGQNHQRVREVLSVPWVLLHHARSAVLMVRGIEKVG